MLFAPSLVGLLGACGGGGNESGLWDSVLASPASVTVTGNATSCAWGRGPTVFVYGGQPPYRLFNSAPMAMWLDRPYLNDSGDGFTVTFVNGVCMDQIPITVEDAMGRVIAVPITNALAN